ncbi:thioredoxin-related transmembrane protein 1-like [Babylonia areolata]|uniref:thioredoxin-related transmembrane protein 1-like n=1 Tax=Babylonia areolata TaxID=304850 RepID=UPI003FD10F34
MASLLLSVAVVVILTSPFATAEKTDPLIRVTDDNWKVVLEGEWMVEFMAPWCPACRSFKSTWQSLAEWSKDLDMKVGVVDVTESPGLSGRFLVTSLPTILHVKDGEFRVYSGPRKENDLLSFVDDKKWQDVEPVSAWIHPNSVQMGAVEFFFKVAMMVRRFYNVMSAEYGIPEWACYILFALATIVVGLLLGLIIVLCCDRLFPPKYVPAHQIIKEDVEDDKDDESDVIEDVSPMEDREAEEAGDSGVRRRQTASPDSSEGKAETISS